MAEALLVATGSNVWTMKDGSPHPTGFWAGNNARKIGRDNARRLFSTTA